MAAKLEWEPHSVKQEQAVFSEKPLTVLATGIQFGKTISGAWWLKRRIHKHPDPDYNYLVTAPTYKVLEQATLPAFLKIMEGWGEYSRQRAVFKCYNGPQVYFRTNTEPDSIVGLTNVMGIWGDEAGKYTLYFWENMQGRSSFKKCPVLLTTSPYTLNWIYKDLIRPTLKGERDDICLIQANSAENKYFPRDEYEKKKLTMDPRRFNMMYGGEWNRMAGLVYDCWDDIHNTIEPFQLPQGTKFYGGIDWGFTDPFVLKVRAVTPDGRHYGVSEFYKSYTTIQDQIMIARQMITVWNVQTFYCDPSEPGLMMEMARAGIPCVAAENDIKLGIQVHYQLIKERKYKEFRGRCPYSQDEREIYHYPDPDDLKPDQDSKEAIPVDQHNHAMDCDRYISIMTYKKGEGKERLVSLDVDKKIHEMNQFERIHYLKNSYKRKKHYETWEE